LLNQELTGININRFRFKLSAFADDLTVGISSLDDWNKFHELLKLYKSASNAKINTNKSKLVPLTDSASHMKLPGEEKFKKLKDKESIKILGFTIDKRGQPGDLWQEMTQDFEEIIKILNKVKPSNESRICFARSYIWSKIWYPASLLPPNREEILKLSDLITQWINVESSLNDIEIPTLENILDARFVLIWIKLLTTNNLWANIERSLIESKLKMNNQSITTLTTQS
ncbi:6526_t:CDS:1, partial [Scutellospora calospora]